MPIEVAPIAHYHMGGVQADASMETEVPGLLVAGEAVGGANGANRLSGNAITEALVFGRQAGRSAAARAKRTPAPKLRPQALAGAFDLLRADAPARPLNTAEMVLRLQTTMADDVGPLRDAARLTRALATIDELTHALAERPAGDGRAFDLARLDWLDLRNMLVVARAVASSALARGESRGAHQREDFPGMLDRWQVNQTVRWRNGALDLAARPAAALAAAQ